MNILDFRVLMTIDVFIESDNLTENIKMQARGGKIKSTKCRETIQPNPWWLVGARTESLKPSASSVRLPPGRPAWLLDALSPPQTCWLTKLRFVAYVLIINPPPLTDRTEDRTFKSPRVYTRHRVHASSTVPFQIFLRSYPTALVKCGCSTTSVMAGEPRRSEVR